MAITLNKQPYKIKWEDIENGTKVSQNLTLENGWLNYNSTTWGSARVERIGNCVKVLGFITRGTTASSTQIALLPPEFRPRFSTNFLCGSSGGTATTITVHASGKIVLEGQAPTNDWLSLSNITYFL